MQSQQIIEIDSVRHILKYISYDTVVFWDLDNTILQSKYHLGSDQWFCQLLSLGINEFGRHTDVIEKLLAIYYAVQERSLSVPVEDASIKIISLLHQIGIPQGVITARGQCLKEATLRQLSEIDVTFLPENIIFCDGKSKADCLEQSIKDRKCHYKHFIMVDDKASHLSDMQELAKRLGSRFHGFSYRYLDAKVMAFDMRYATVQLQVLCEFLSLQTQTLINEMRLIKPQEEIKEFDDFVFFDPNLESHVQIDEDKLKLTSKHLAKALLPTTQEFCM